MKQHKQGLAKGALLLSVIILFGGLYLADPSALHHMGADEAGRNSGNCCLHPILWRWGGGVCLCVDCHYECGGIPAGHDFFHGLHFDFRHCAGHSSGLGSGDCGSGHQFHLFRTFLRNSAERLIAGNARISAWDEKSRTEGFRVMMIARIIPYFPAAVINAFGALSKMSFRDYILASFIGKFPATAIEALIGHDTVTIHQNPLRLGVVIGISILLYVIFSSGIEEIGK